MQQKMWVVYAEGISEYFAMHISDDEARTLQQICDRLLVAATSVAKCTKTYNPRIDWRRSAPPINSWVVIKKPYHW